MPFSKVIGDGAPQYPIKPCHRAFVPPQSVAVLQCAQPTLLEQILGFHRVPDPGADKPMERV